MTRVREVWMGWLPSHWFIYGALSTWQASVALQMSTNWPRRAQREGAHVDLTLTSRVLLNPKRHAIASSVDLEVTSGLLLKKIIHVVNNGHPSKPESRKFLQTVLKWSCPWNWRLLIQVFLLVYHLRLRRKRSDLCLVSAERRQRQLLTGRNLHVGTRKPLGTSLGDWGKYSVTESCKVCCYVLMERTQSTYEPKVLLEGLRVTSR